TLARTPVQELEEYLGLKLLDPMEASDIETVGGLISTLAGRVPVRGELIPHPSGLAFEVLDADRRRIKKPRVHLPASPDVGPAACPRPPGPRRCAPDGGEAKCRKCLGLRRSLSARAGCPAGAVASPPSLPALRRSWRSRRSSSGRCSGSPCPSWYG